MSTFTRPISFGVPHVDADHHFAGRLVPDHRADVGQRLRADDEARGVLAHVPLRAFQADGLGEVEASGPSRKPSSSEEGPLLERLGVFSRAQRMMLASPVSSIILELVGDFRLVRGCAR
jgi:hypothetical protein